MSLIRRILENMQIFCKNLFHLVYLFVWGGISSVWQRFHCDEETYPIDFVVTWVDGSDPVWRQEKQNYAEMSSGQEVGTQNKEARYRNWDTLVFWFRAVEKFAPWVNHVYFITCGHKPEWLNLNSEKLRFVTHDSFMPEAYLPTFSSTPIELNMWRIPGLSEHFVYFNDDVFLNRPVKPRDFFHKGLPKECAVAKPMRVKLRDGLDWNYTLLNDYAVINESFDIRRCIRKAPAKWFTYLINTKARYNWRLYSDGYLIGMLNPHITRAFLKQTFADLWDRQNELLDQTSKSRFRTNSNVTIQLVTLWMLFSGAFYPAKNIGYFTTLTSNSIEGAVNVLLSSDYKVVCLNDSDSTEESEFEFLKAKVLEAFSKKFPEKSSYEI